MMEKMILRKRPNFTIMGMSIVPDPYTMAFGGVATGNMNAREQERATAIAGRAGLTPKGAAAAITIGTSILAVAVFETSSVEKIVKTLKDKISKKKPEPRI